MVDVKAVRLVVYWVVRKAVSRVENLVWNLDAWSDQGHE